MFFYTEADLLFLLWGIEVHCDLLVDSFIFYHKVLVKWNRDIYGSRLGPLEKNNSDF